MNITELSRSIRLATSKIEGWNSDHKADSLISLVLWTKPKRILEVGVFGGKSLCVFGLSLQYLGQGHITGIDSWTTSAVVDSHETAEEKQWWAGHGEGPGSVLEQRRLEAIRWVKTFGLDPYCTIRQADAHQVSSEYENESFDIIHLDADKSHIGSLREIHTWLPKLRIGGYLVYDDCDWLTRRAAYMEARERCRELYEHRAPGDGFAVLKRER
jgi:predicted O-methyltransferase YrrM